MAAIYDLSSQQLYYCTKADLEPGNLSESATYVYLTPNLDAAIWGADVAIDEGRGRVYLVEPTLPLN